MAPLAKGIPLKVVLVNDNSAGNDAVMVDHEVQEHQGPQGQDGRTGGIQRLAFRARHCALAKNGMTPKDVKIVNLSAGDAAAAFLSGRVDAATVWNPWVNKIETCGKGKALFTSKDMPGLVPDLLVAQEKSLEANRTDFVGMVKAWYDAEVHPREAGRGRQDHGQGRGHGRRGIQGVPARHAVLRRRRTISRRSARPSTPQSLLASAPAIMKFLEDNKLIEGKPDFAKGDRCVAREGSREEVTAIPSEEHAHANGRPAHARACGRSAAR